MNQKFIKKGIINYTNNSYIWYHSTLNGLVDKILSQGLKIYSIPTLQEVIQPCIYVSVMPFCREADYTTLAVDLSNINIKDISYPVDMQWQLRIFKNIPPEYLSIYIDHRKKKSKIHYVRNIYKK